MAMMPPKPRTITQAEFDKYSAYWALLVSQQNPDLLLNCFLRNKQDKSSKMTYASFLPQHLGLLLSTVGIQHVEARFVVMADLAAPQQASFALVLYATDALGTRLSAYYVGSPVMLPVEAVAAPPTPPATPGAASPAGDGTQVPGNIVVSWVHNWLNTKELNSKMFTNSYGPLQGYTFSVGDLIQPLFSSQVAGAWNILFNFGLHEYYGPSDDTTLAHTFGLIIRLHRAPTPSTGGGTTEPDPQDDEPGEPFYDMSTPRPPFRAAGE